MPGSRFTFLGRNVWHFPSLSEPRRPCRMLLTLLPELPIARLLPRAPRNSIIRDMMSVIVRQEVTLGECAVYSRLDGGR